AAAIVRMRWAHPDKLHHAIPHSQIPAARFFPGETSVACTCCPGRSAIGRGRRSNAAALLPDGPASQAVPGHCAHPGHVAHVDLESKSEFQDLERALEEMIPARGLHKEKALDRRIRWVLSYLRRREE